MRALFILSCVSLLSVPTALAQGQPTQQSQWYFSSVSAYYLFPGSATAFCQSPQGDAEPGLAVPVSDGQIWVDCMIPSSSSDTSSGVTWTIEYDDAVGTIVGGQGVCGYNGDYFQPLYTTVVNGSEDYELTTDIVPSAGWSVCVGVSGVSACINQFTPTTGLTWAGRTAACPYVAVDVITYSCPSGQTYNTSMDACCSTAMGYPCGSDCSATQCDGSCYDPGCGDDNGGGGGGGGGGDQRNKCEFSNPGDGAEWDCGDELCDSSGCDSTGCNCVDQFDPITIDLGNAAYLLTNPQNGVKFDFFNKGTLSQMAWTAKGWNGGFLALDRNGNGKIDDGAELFGNTTLQTAVEGKKPNGFLALAEFDKPENGGNGDGQIDSKDAVYSKLVVWIDKNHNGISEPGELISLKDASVESISLHYVSLPWIDAYGNKFRYAAQIQRAGIPQPTWTYDVILGAMGKPVAPTSGSTSGQQ